MKTVSMTMVRIYITESSKLLNSVVDYLQKDAKIRGISVFRAISGFGETGLHTTNLLDLALDLPLVIEFFDLPDKIMQVLNHLSTIVKPLHMVTWPANVVSTE